MKKEDSIQSTITACRKKHAQVLENIDRYFRTVNYIAAAQIYLQDNVLLKRTLEEEDIKDRLLGHWGTVPGINLIYAHLNRLINDNKLDMFLVTGPGHGAPANIANLYLEGSMKEYYPDLTLDEKGLHKIIKDFSWPGGFPSHLYPGIPGTIHEGGELGYSLGTAFGAVMDIPDLIVPCIIGDGEAEAGPTLAAYHSTKFIDPKRSGAVLPILHLNGYKIANPTIYGTMDDNELIQLFSGFGYQVRIVQHEDIHADLFTALDWALHEIQKIQKEARSSTKPCLKPQFPLLILKTEKGWTGIKKLDGEIIEGSCLSHQVPAKDLKTNPTSLRAVEEWLLSYKPQELFDKHGKPVEEVLSICPKEKYRMGTNKHTFGISDISALKQPSIFDFSTTPSEDQENALTRGTNYVRNTKQVGKYLAEIIRLNPSHFRIFSPDEMESNQLGDVFSVTEKEYQWPTRSYDKHIGGNGGQVIEILSEHCCQAWLQGYLLTGRYGLFPSYEAFLGIISTMMNQYAKFLKFSKEIPWRTPVPSLNYLETSTLWQQEHNGFSHQNPGFINTLLNIKADTVRIYLPPDANTLVSTMDHCVASKGYVNLVVAGKLEMPQWLTMKEAIDHCRAGASIWKWASTDAGINPDVVLVGIGDNPHLEIMAASQILREEFPELRIRVVNITDLLILEKETLHPHGLDDEMFEALFTHDKPVIINFHGYPSAIKQLLYGRNASKRFYIHGYKEEGTTTTPFDITVRNETSRYHLIMQAIRVAAKSNPEVAAASLERISHYEYVLAAHRKFIVEHGKDPDEISNWRWK